MSHPSLRVGLTLLAVLALASLPAWSGDLYQVHLASLIGAYWVLVAGLNLVVGFAGQLSIGHVGLLAVGAYGFAILAGTVGLDPFLALPLCGALRGPRRPSPPGCRPCGCRASTSPW